MDLKEYLKEAPEVVFEWNDTRSEARGWVVINSLKNGAAGGGTRMRPGLTKEEVVSLAKVMEVKFSVSGPPIGGAKSGIDFDPSDPRREEVLRRWYKVVFPLLKNYYGTGGDLNVDELKDVIPITESLGLWHPQEGVVNGYYEAEKGAKVRRLGQLRMGVIKILEDQRYTPQSKKKLAVADMITGWGVAESVRHYYDLWKQEESKGKRAIIQGWGNVAASAAYYLGKQGVKIVGIIDKAGGLIVPDGMEGQRVTDLFLNKNGNQLRAEGMMSFEEANAKIWDVPADIFIPGAASKILTRKQMESFIGNGGEVISCGANVPFVDDKVFFGETAEWVDNEISLIPDFIANCGMARTFAYLMGDEVEISDHSIFSDSSDTIRKALEEIRQVDDSDRKLFQKGISIALKKTS